MYWYYCVNFTSFLNNQNVSNSSQKIYVHTYYSLKIKFDTGLLIKNFTQCYFDPMKKVNNFYYVKFQVIQVCRK